MESYDSPTYPKPESDDRIGQADYCGVKKYSAKEYFIWYTGQYWRKAVMNRNVEIKVKITESLGVLQWIFIHH